MNHHPAVPAPAPKQTLPLKEETHPPHAPPRVRPLRDAGAGSSKARQGNRVPWRVTGLGLRSGTSLTGAKLRVARRQGRPERRGSEERGKRARGRPNDGQRELA
ncbi:hypothetical protein CALVIDRAFT_318821 [Calocera viscosa TUFC12733]|uniref:Uncharacterized protein n=1 Tax=Calocera viscosa (strain TUFC12733) TaxID=1330018 RepID=A0A167HY66_CALVF|nr:hypothetical protein CALVIDRAFT_318821 [Calocera viscosa TUFC12733]